jgi:hypothetical protein
VGVDFGRNCEIDTDLIYSNVDSAKVIKLVAIRLAS